jgi:hypothetical protein
MEGIQMTTDKVADMYGNKALYLESLSLARRIEQELHTALETTNVPSFDCLSGAFDVTSVCIGLLEEKIDLISEAIKIEEAPPPMHVVST